MVIVGGMFAFLHTKKRAENPFESKGDFASAVAVDNRELVEEGVEGTNESTGAEQDGSIIRMDTNVSDLA